MSAGRAGSTASEPDLTNDWEALVHPGQKLKPGSRIVFEGAVTLHGEILERRFFGRRTVRLWTDEGISVRKQSNRSVISRCRRTSSGTIAQRIASAIRPSSRSAQARLRRRPRASTSAAPLVAALNGRAESPIAEITLHVGYGTFQPVRVEHVEDHRVEPERYEISQATADSINEALGKGVE